MIKEKCAKMDNLSSSKEQFLLIFLKGRENAKQKRLLCEHQHFSVGYLLCYLLLTISIISANQYHHHPRKHRNDSSVSVSEHPPPSPAPPSDDSDHPNKTSSTSITNVTRRGRNSGSNDSSGGYGTPPTLLLKPEHFSIPVGGVIQLFPRYGYFHLSMKVISKIDRNTSSSSTSSSSNSPRNDSWLFLEPINNVIEPSTLEVEESSISPQNDNNSLPFHNLFHIDLCEDIDELLEAYFKNFTIDGLDKPWQAFSGGWRIPTIARYFGIDQTFIEGDYRFILVKVLLVRGSGSVIHTGNTTSSSTYHPNFLRFQPDNDLSTYEFFKTVGTHYIHAYIIGNALYQVFVYDADGFHNVKQRLFYDGIKHQKTSEFIEKLPETLSLWVKHTGKVFVLSSAPDVLDSVRRALIMYTAHTGSTSNIFKLHNNSKLVHEIELMLATQPNGVLGIDLRRINFLFKDPLQRAGFEKALKHQMQLWEINFQY